MRTKGTGPQGLGIKGNNGYHIGSPAKFKAHKMYGKDGEVETAKTKEKHLSLKDEGYGHSSPAKKKDACYTKVAKVKTLLDLLKKFQKKHQLLGAN